MERIRKGLVKFSWLLLKILPEGTPTEIHVEKLDATLPRVKRFCIEHPDVMLMIEANENPLESIKELSSLKNPVGLHTHIALETELVGVPYSRQHDLVAMGKQILADLFDRQIEHFAPGFWALNKTTIKVLKNLGFVYVHTYFTLSRDKWMIEDAGLKPVLVSRYCHDFDLR